MTRADDYRRNAEKAEELARAAATDDERRAYMKIAQGWRELEAAAKAVQKRGL